MKNKLVLGALVFAGIATGVAHFGFGVAQGTTSRLDTIKKRGKLICGVNATLPGFGFLDSSGKYTGFDVDFCRGVAAAVFGDASKVDYVSLTAAARFTAIQSGEVDVVFRNTTLTSSRDGDVGVDFGPINFYDGQGVMVKNNSTAKRIADLAGATICTNQGTTTEQNINDYFRQRKLNVKVVTYQDFNLVMAAFDQGRCDAVTTDASGLAAQKATRAEGSTYRILGEIISKEPLGPFVAQNDSKWRDVVTWTVYATIYAEELGIDSRNIAEARKNTTNPAVRRFVGLEGNSGKGFGLNPDFAADIIQAVGNYKEIYDRHLGPRTKINIPRRLNANYAQGGLLYSPPFR
ncbi:MAG: amino acid ABC transporter substrate-binding protein [Deinococcales bacterium]